MASAAFWLQSSTHTLPLLQQRLSKLCSAYSLLIEFSSAFILRLSSDPSMSAQQPRCLHCLSGHISLRNHFIFFSMSEKQRAIPELYCSPSHQRALPMLPPFVPNSALHPTHLTVPSSPVLSSPLVLSIHSSPLLASILAVAMFTFLYVCCGGGGGGGLCKYS